MITVDRTAPPYLFTGTILGAATIITFFKGANELITCFTQNTDPENEQKQSLFSSKNTKCQKIFKGLAWVGTSLLAGYGFYELQKSFLNVSAMDHHTFDLQVYQKDLDSYQALQLNQWRERIPLRNFCLSYLQSAEAYSSLNKKPSWFTTNPNIAIAKSAHKAVLRIEREFQALKAELEERTGFCQKDLSKLKNTMRNYPAAKGVKLNLDEFCEMPLTFLVSNLCRRYQDHKSYLEKYQKTLSRIDEYKKEILNERQYERCREVYAIHPVVKRIPNDEDLNKQFPPSNSNRVLSKIYKLVQNFNPFTSEVQI